MSFVSKSNLARVQKEIAAAIAAIHTKRDELVEQLEQIIEIKEEAKATFEMLKGLGNTAQNGEEQHGEAPEVTNARVALTELLKEEMQIRAKLAQLDESIQNVNTGE